MTGVQTCALPISLPEHGTAFLNCDDHYVSQFGRDFSGRAIYFGRGPLADPRIESTESLGADGVRVNVRAGDSKATFHLHLLGEHNVSNAAAAIAVGIASGISLETCCAALTELEPDEKRGRVVTVRGAKVINDSYNSNPEALKSMIATLAAMPIANNGRRILVAGEMLELGSQSATLHAACGEKAAESGIDLVVGVRGFARNITERAAALGVQAIFYNTPEEAGTWLRQNLRAGDAVLLKASRGVRLERALEVLTSEDPL